MCDGFEGRLQAFLKRCGHVAIEATRIGDRLPIDAVVPHGRMLAIKDQAREVGPDVVQSPLRDKRRNAHVAEFRNLALEMERGSSLIFHDRFAFFAGISAGAWPAKATW